MPRSASASTQNRIPGTQSDGEGAAPGSSLPLRSPADVAELLNRYHLERDYDAVTDLIVPDRAGRLIEFLKAVDGVIDANAELRPVAIRRLGGPLSNAWSLGAMKNNLGVFSAEIDVINQTFRGRTAVVTLQEADNVPLVRVRFLLKNGVWLLDPDTAPRSMIPELRRLAAVLRGVTADLDEDGTFEAYVNAFLHRVVPQMGRVVLARDEQNVRMSATTERDLSEPRP